MTLYVPTPEQLGTLFDAGFKVEGTNIVAIMEVNATRHKRAINHAIVPPVANVWYDGLLSLRCAPQQDGYYQRKITHCATQEEAFNRAMAYVLLGLYDEGAEGI